MRTKLLLPLVCLTAIFLVSCAQTTIYPEGNNSFSLVTTSAQQGYAEQDAEKKASKYCQEKGQSLVVISHHTEYHGPDKTNAAMIGLASALLTPNAGNPANSNDNYEVTMKFKCQ